MGDRLTVSEIVDTPVAVTLPEFLEATHDAIWYGRNDGPGCFSIEMHGSRRPRLIVEYERG